MNNIISHPWFFLTQITVWGLHRMKKRLLLIANDNRPLTPEDRVRYYTGFVNNVLKGN